MSEIKTEEIYCFPDTDKLGTFWNYTKAGKISYSPCPKIPGFNPAAFAERQCTGNGSWYFDNSTKRFWSNYQPCLFPHDNQFSIYIFFIGHSISAIFLVVSLFIFHYLKELKCHRITLHKNLFTCYLCNALVWLILHGLSVHPNIIAQNYRYCLIVFILASYFSTATYFWMLSEGVYLAVVLLKTFVADLKYLLFICISIGWGVPGIFCVVYISCKMILESSSRLQIVLFALHRCWLEKSKLIYILQIPGIIALFANVAIIFFILKLLITKIKYPTSTMDERHWGRTGKSVFILVLLLGVQNIFFLYQPTDRTSSLIHEYVSAVLTSFQGLFVSCLLCFNNKEIKITWKRRQVTKRKLLSVSSVTHRRNTIPGENYHHSNIIAYQMRRRLTATIDEMSNY